MKHLPVFLFVPVILALLVGPSPAAGQSYAVITNFLDGTVSIIDTSTDTVTTTLDVGPGPLGVVWHPDGSEVYVSNFDDGESDTIQVIDPVTWTVVDTFSSGGPGPKGMDVTPDGTRLVVANQGRHNLPPDCAAETVSIIDLATRSIVTSFEAGDNPWGVLVHPNNGMAYVTSAHFETLNKVDWAAGTLVDSVLLGDGCADPGVGVDHHPCNLLLHPDENTLYISHMHAGRISKYDVSTDRITDFVDVSQGFCPDTKCFHPMGTVLSPDGSTLYVAYLFKERVGVYDADTLELQTEIGVGDHPKNVDLTPDGSKLYVVNQFDDDVSVIDTASRQVIATIPVGDDPRPFVRFIGTPPGLALAGTAEGVALKSVKCNNTTTNESVQFPIPVGVDSWNCEAEGLGVTATDRVTTTLMGRATSDVSLRAEVFRMDLKEADCLNNTSGESVHVQVPPGEEAVDCIAAGLAVSVDDRVRMVLSGPAL